MSKNKQRHSHSKSSDLKSTALYIAIFILYGILALYSFALLFSFTSLTPSISAFLMDKHKEKYITKTVTCLNIAGALPYIIAIASHPRPDVAAHALLYDYNVWFSILFASSLGWVLIWVMPKIVASIIVAQAEMKIEKLNRLRDEIIAEWGEGIKGEKNGDALILTKKV